MCAVDERHIVEFVEEGVLNAVAVGHATNGISAALRCAARAWPCAWSGTLNSISPASRSRSNLMDELQRLTARTRGETAE